MVVDCTHPRANHQHGTYLAYAKDGCRCDPCTIAYRRHAKHVDYRTRTKTHTYVDAGRARRHVLALLEVLTPGQIEHRSGVHRTAIRVLVGKFPGRPASKRITRTTQDALLAVQPTLVGPEASGLVDRTGTQRRLRGLIALGWPAAYLASRMGASNNLGKLTADAGSPVQASTRAKVAALYDELALTVPEPSRGSTLARGVAKRKGWVVPLAWDDDTIDDPAAAPYVEAPRRRTSAELLEDFEDTFEHHRGDLAAAAERLGVSYDALSQAYYRARRETA